MGTEPAARSHDDDDDDPMRHRHRDPPDDVRGGHRLLPPPRGPRPYDAAHGPDVLRAGGDVLLDGVSVSATVTVFEVIYDAAAAGPAGDGTHRVQVRTCWSDWVC